MSNLKWIVSVVFVMGVCGVLIFTIGAMAPGNFPKGEVVPIPRNTSLSGAAQALYDHHIIRSPFLFKAMVVIFGGQKSIAEGEYLFSEPQSVIRVAYRTINGVHGQNKTKITIPEGSSSKDIAWIILKNIPEFDAPAFQAQARPYEGYLFPDTYFFYENVKPEEVLSILRGTFDTKMSTIESEFASSTKKLKVTKEEIITMASIIEREGIDNEDRKIIAGILWKRIRAGMALQVDAPFYYLYNKPSSQLTLDDLKIKSPYNTYVNVGLPPGPISNPGLEAIVDTMNPTETKYWYYLTGKDGKMYYAADLEGHTANKRKYL